MTNQGLDGKLTIPLFAALDKNAMRNSYHVCLSSHEEVMYRSQEDLIYGFNCIAIAAYETGSRLIADAELTTHNHTVVQSDKIEDFVFSARYPYAKHFNKKYHRKGRLGEKIPFITTLEGYVRLTAAVSYVNRQGLHHGLSSTPFGYKYCSSNAVFCTELGKETNPPQEKNTPLLSRWKKIPESFRVDYNGMILREDALDINYLHEIYLTPRNFLYQMNRLTDETWVNEQIKESQTLPIVTLETIESNVDGFDLKKMLINEKGRQRYDLLSDLDLCQIIDYEYVPEMAKGDGLTIYDFEMKKRRDIGNKLWSKYGPMRCSSKQIRRCAVIK